jgi:EAL domain-containing protein (putative c-di-GMP-specific phosphodiesterase class I)
VIATSENRRSRLFSLRRAYDAASKRFDQAVAGMIAAPGWAGVLVLGALLATIWAIVYGSGGTKDGFPHLFYLPIILAAFRFGFRGSLATAVAAGILCGRLLPLDTLTGEQQALSDILVRAAMFLVIAWFASASMALRRRLDAEHLSRDLRAAIIGPADESLSVDLSLVPLIPGVLERRAFHPVFQPIYSLSDGHLIAVEALTRFDVEPVRAPDVWFLAAHHAGRGADLELAAIEAAIEGAVDLPENVELWLNLSPMTVAHPRLRALLDMCDERKIALELSEHEIVSDYDVLVERLVRVRQAGVQIAVDDAGAGFASMRHIVNLAPEITKLDISLTQDLASSQVRRALGEAMIAFVHRMDGLLVVEGIETAADLTAWAALGADAVQGYLTGYPGPLPAERLSASLIALLGIAAYHPTSATGEPLPRRRSRPATAEAARSVSAS